MSERSQLSMLQATANQILATVAPKTHRLVQTKVVLEDEAQTASTDGETRIIMPTSFCGEGIPDNQAVSVGLLAHEVSHFLQPLRQIDQVQEEANLPHWLANLAIDIQGESLLQSIFPSLREPLKSTRQVVHISEMVGYQQSIAAAQTFEDAVVPLALQCRFARPSEVFDHTATEMVENLPFGPRMQELMDRLSTAATLPATALPNFLRNIMRRFPELAHTEAPDLPMMAPRIEHSHAHADILLAEIKENVGLWGAGDQEPIKTKAYKVAPPTREVLQLSCRIQARFDATNSAIEVMAPSRFDRHEAVRGNLPFRMALPGPERPSAKVVICVDVSSSMRGPKETAAFFAAQALALAVENSGGDVVGLLFDGAAAVDKRDDSSALFSQRRQWRNAGGTCFLFLSEVWRRWPNHHIVLLTDGCGSISGVLPQDKRRTAAIVIPDGDSQTMALIADRVVELDDMDRLPSVMAMLVPRATLA